MYLFFDTETTGLPRDYKGPLSDLNNWPRMVQIAWVFQDGSGGVIESSCHIIKPQGFTIPRDASNLHRITTARAVQEGAELSVILKKFHELVTASSFLVAHNISFDEKIVGA